MKIVYAESSAVLAWLLGEPQQDSIRAVLSAADRVVTSALTVIECSRGLARARELGRATESGELAALHLLDQAAASWSVLDISDRVAQRARGSFPREPVRTLDAIHLATAIAFNDALGDVGVLSLDARVRGNASVLGLAVEPGG